MLRMEIKGGEGKSGFSNKMIVGYETERFLYGKVED